MTDAVWQTLLVGVILLAALIYVAGRIRRYFKPGGSVGCGCCRACDSPPLRNLTETKTEIKVDSED